MARPASWSVDHDGWAFEFSTDVIAAPHDPIVLAIVAAMTTQLPRVLTAPAARALGISPWTIRRQVDRGWWQTLGCGVVLTTAEPPTRTDWLALGVTLGGAGCAVSGWDAVRRRGLGPRTPPDKRALVLTRGGKNRTVGGVHLRPSHRPVAVTMTSIRDPVLPLAPVVHLPRAIADTAIWTANDSDVRAMVTGAIQRGLCEIPDLVAELELSPRNGSGSLRAAMLDVIDGARSSAEADALKYLRRGRLPTFEMNVPVHDQSGRVVAVIDVLWRELRIALEIDSREFHFGEAAWKTTMQRHNLLSRAGLAVAHHPPSAIRRGPAWVDEVRIDLKARAKELGVAYRPCAPGHPVAQPRPYLVSL